MKMNAKLFVLRPRTFPASKPSVTNSGFVQGHTGDPSRRIARSFPCMTGENALDNAIREQILSLLDQHRIMTIATLRPDGWPQATTVGYVSEGLNLHFLCGRESQKAANLSRDDRVSLTID